MKNMHTDVRELRFKECIVRLGYCHLLCMSTLKVNKSNVLFPFHDNEVKQRRLRFR